MFNLFGKSKDVPGKKTFTDKVFISNSAKMNACLELAKEQPNTLFIAWFADTAKQYKDFFQQHSIDSSCITEVRMLHIELLNKHIPVFLEHYPLHEKETAAVAEWPQEKIIVYNALDEPLFKYFGGDKITSLITTMGMDENECIEHPLVSKSIINGQQKIAGSIVIEQSAGSQAKWMEINLKADL